MQTTKSQDKTVAAFIASTRELISTLNSTEEIQRLPNYIILTELSDELILQGLPPATACRAACRTKFKLPPAFNVNYPDEFNEMIKLWGVAITNMYQTVVQDFDQCVVEEVFLKLCDNIEVELDVA